MVDVVGVHGIGQQQGGRHQMLPVWQAALADGVERARGRVRPAPSLDLAFYGDLFLTGTGTKGPAAVLEDVDADTLDFLERVQGEVVDPAEPVSAEAGRKGFTELPAPVGRLAAWVERRFGVAGKLLFFGDLVQVRRFQRDDDLAATVIERVGEVLDETSRVLIGHSLGSIVAYESLCRIPGHGVRTLVTLGSPLGLRSIREALRPEAQNRLPDLPHGVERWVNCYDTGDPVSLAGGLAPHWPLVEDEQVDNGDQPHAISRYLGKKVTGAAVADALS